MESNIQVLLDKIYDEGINKSKSESEKILRQAKEEAERILNSAKQDSQKILEKSKLDAKVLRESTEADLKAAKNQTISSLHTEIANLISKKTIDSGVKSASLDVNFLKDMMLKVTESWMRSGVGPDQMEVLIPNELKSEWESHLKSVMADKLDGLRLTGSSIKSGFQILRSDKGFRVDFTDEAMKEFFRSYLRQKTAEWLFKE